MPEATKIEIIARALVICADHVLVCQHVSKGGYLVLPGGHVEPGETGATASVRELLEETGLDLPAGPCLVAHEQIFEQRGRRRHELTLVFHVEHPPASGSIPPRLVSPEEPKIRLEWVHRDAVETADLRPTPLRQWVAHRLSGNPAPPSTPIDWIA